MFKTLVIGIDDPDDTEALALARRLADPRARLVAVRITPIDALPGRDTLLYFDAAAVRETERSARRFGMAHAEVEVATESAASVGEGLAAIAGRLGADAIVVGSSRHGPLGHMFAGDAVRGTMRHAHCAVAAAPLGYAEEPRPLSRIAVGHDGSAAADAALHRAEHLRDRDHGTIQVITVTAAPGSWETGAQDPSLASVGVDGPIAVRAPGGQIGHHAGVDGALLSGAAAHTLAVAAQDADLLAIGLQHPDHLDRLLHGSTASALLRDQRAPLLMVPAPDAAGPRDGGP